LRRSTPIHLAVVDHRLPDMEGLVVITKLKEIDAGMQTLLLTGHGDEKLKEVTEALNSTYFDKAEMGKFWGFLRKVLQRLETSMAAAGMAAGGDLEDAVEIETHGTKTEKIMKVRKRCHKRPSESCWWMTSKNFYDSIARRLELMGYDSLKAVQRKVKRCALPGKADRSGYRGPENAGHGWPGDHCQAEGNLSGDAIHSADGIRQRKGQAGDRSAGCRILPERRDG
jgi:hypothetical protein